MSRLRLHLSRHGLTKNMKHPAVARALNPKRFWPVGKTEYCLRTSCRVFSSSRHLGVREQEACLSLLHDIPPEVEARPDREPHRAAGVLDNVVEQVIANQVRLHAQTKVVGEQEVRTTAESVEVRP